MPEGARKETIHVENTTNNKQYWTALCAREETTPPWKSVFPVPWQ